MLKRLNEKVNSEIISNIDAKTFAVRYSSWKGDLKVKTDLIVVSTVKGDKKTTFHMDLSVFPAESSDYLSITEEGAEPLARFPMIQFIDPEIAFEVAKAALMRVAV